MCLLVDLITWAHLVYLSHFLITVLPPQLLAHRAVNSWRAAVKWDTDESCSDRLRAFLSTARFKVSLSVSSSVHFAVSRAKMDAERWRHTVWHGVASCLGATRVTVHSEQGSNDVIHVRLQILPKGTMGMHIPAVGWSYTAAKPMTSQSPRRPLWLLLYL